MMEMAFYGQLWTQARQFSHSPSATEWPSTTFQEPCGHTEVQMPHPTQASVEKTIFSERVTVGRLRSRPEER